MGLRGEAAVWEAGLEVLQTETRSGGADYRKGVGSRGDREPELTAQEAHARQGTGKRPQT